MSYIESSKSYTGTDLDTVFFRPMLCGASAQELGIKVLYNMPVPTSIQIWTGQNDILTSHTTTGWNATTKSAKTYKTIDMKRVKAEMGFAASDYYSIVFEDLATRAEINLDDLTGTELEKVETELFRRSLSESLRSTMWIGDTTRTSGHNTFTGFLPKIISAFSATTASEKISTYQYDASSLVLVSNTLAIFDKLWSMADDKVKDAKGDGELVYFVTSDIYTNYEKALDASGVDASYIDSINGRSGLMYHGIPVVDVRIGSYIAELGTMDSFVILADRRNLVMAVNTADFPGSEIRMWYNPDEMENRQRAIFAVGCEIVDPSMITVALKVVDSGE